LNGSLPEPQPLIVTEHRAHSCCCAACGAQTRAGFPEGVNAPVQYGAPIAGIVVYLLHGQFLPEKRLAALMADLFGIHLATATIAAMSRNCAADREGWLSFPATPRNQPEAQPWPTISTTIPPRNFAARSRTKSIKTRGFPRRRRRRRCAQRRTGWKRLRRTRKNAAAPDAADHGRTQNP
jgi:hypothetical protein